MAEPTDLVPTKVVALVVVPLLFGLLLLGLLFDLGATAWAMILTFVIGGILLLAAILGRAVILQKQRSPPETAEE